MREGVCSYLHPHHLRGPCLGTCRPSPPPGALVASEAVGAACGLEEHDCPAPPSGPGSGGEGVPVFPGLRDGDGPTAQSGEGAPATAPLGPFLYVQRVCMLSREARFSGFRGALAPTAAVPVVRARVSWRQPPTPPPALRVVVPLFRSHKEAIDCEE